MANAAPIPLIGAAFLLSLWPPGPAGASPDGAEWETVNDPAGCKSCHLGTSDVPTTGSLAIEGLPEQVEAGRDYELTISLVDAVLDNAGFLLRIESDAGAPGKLSPVDARTEVMGALARSTWDGSWPAQAGKASWRLVWTAPAAPAGTLVFDLWANAGNDDASPLGDRPQHRSWRLPAAP